MGKWILTKELFDSDILKAQNEIPYLQGNLTNSYQPINEERMNLNTLLTKCPYFDLCSGVHQSPEHYATYEDGIYLFIFINANYRCHIALNLKNKESVDLAFIIYDLPINPTVKSLSYIGTDISLTEVVFFLGGESIEVLGNYGFDSVVNFNHEISLTRMN